MAGEPYTVGRYQVLRRVGDRGGMAEVYLAYEPDRERDVALKQMDFRSTDPQLAERFLRESRIVGALDHPNIVAVYELFEHEGVPYIAMEYLEHGSLRARLRTLTPPQQFGVLEGVLAGLWHAHEAGVVHRDLKPENLLIADDGAIKIADFGIAKAKHSGDAHLTATGLTVGTPAYMAPEQAQARPITPATDLYALGVVAYEMISGRVPFADASAPITLIFRKINEPSPSLGLVAPGVDARLAAWVDRLLARPPEGRPRTARAAWVQLEEIVSDLLGPHWRRDARIAEPGARPLPHAQFDTPEYTDYQTFVAPAPRRESDVDRRAPASKDPGEPVLVRRPAPPPPAPPAVVAAPPAPAAPTRAPTLYRAGPGLLVLAGIVAGALVVLALLATLLALAL